MRAHPDPGHDERGQITTALVIVVLVFVCAVALTGTLLVSRGVDDKTKAQSAADASALAAAGGSGAINRLNELIGSFGTKADLGRIGQGCTDVGRAEAEEYASKNDASLIVYCYNLWTGQVQTRVRMNHPVSSKVGPATASSTAESGLIFSNCTFTDAPGPTPSDTPTPTSSPSESPSSSPSPPSPPPNIGTALSCGSALTASFTIDGSSGLFTGTPQIDLNLDSKLTD